MPTIHAAIPHADPSLMLTRAAPNGLPVGDTAQPQQHGRGPDTIVELSPQAQPSNRQGVTPTNPGAGHNASDDSGHSQDTGQHHTPPTPTHTTEPSDHPPTQPQERSTSGRPLTQEEQQQVEKLKARDREVRQHEAAHKAAAGGLARGGPTFEFQTGPDGRRYAVGGEVQIDTSPVPGDPAATIQKMETVRRAALAPAQPSSQDRAVAAQAARQAQKARQQLRQQQSQEASGSQPESASPTAPAVAEADQQAADHTVAPQTTMPPSAATNPLVQQAGQLLDLEA